MSSIRRNRAGTKAVDLWNWPKQDIKDMTGPLKAQEYLQQMISKYHFQPNLIIGADPSKVEQICQTPEGIDEYLWQYEHIRQFIVELNLLVVQLQDGICTAELCPKMKASDTWLYRCASHSQPQDCCAIDYMIHSLDHATSTL